MRILIVSLLLLLLWVPQTFAQEAQKGKTYSDTPEDIKPYRGFSKDYRPFFADPQPFLGTGREKKAPKNLKTVKIGFMGPLDDASAEAPLGHRMLRGAQLAIEEANAAGGYRGMPFEMIIRDDVGPWGSASNKLVELNDQKVWAVLGSVDGQATHIAIRVALKLELPVVTSGSSDPTLTETRIPWYVRVNADDRRQGYALADYVYKERKWSRVAILRVNSRYGRVGIGEFRDAARRLGKPVLFELRHGVGDKQFDQQLKQIKDANPEVVVLWADCADMAYIVRQARALGIRSQFVGPDRIVDPLFTRIAGKAAEGVIATYWFDPTRKDPKWTGFQQRFYKRFGEYPEEQAAHAFDGMNLIIESIRKVGMNRPLIRDYITGLKTFDGVTGKIIFDETWNDVGPVHMAYIKNGQFRYFPAPASGKTSPAVARR